MKLHALLLAASVAALTACAQQEATAPAHTQDYAAAVAQAQRDNRVLVLEFTGSDWCPPCMAMGREVISTPAYHEFASANVVHVKLDFPRRTEQPAEMSARNRGLMERYKVQGFPTFVIVRADGTELARHVGYMRGGVDAFTGWVRNNTPKS
jgi:thiol-disulfide isomerase/thioredoxin